MAKFSSFKYLSAAAIAAIAVGTAASLTHVAHVEALNRACEENLRQLYLRLSFYSGEHNSLLPPLARISNGVRLAPAELNLELPNDYPNVRPASFTAPMHERGLGSSSKTDDRPHSKSYWYLAFAVDSESDALAFVDSLQEERFEIRPVRFVGCFSFFLEDLTFLGHDSGALPPLFAPMTTQPQLPNWDWKAAPVLIERPGIHGNGGHVLWANGTVEFVEFPGRFPMTETFIAALEELDPAS